MKTAAPLFTAVIAVSPETIAFLLTTGLESGFSWWQKVKNFKAPKGGGTAYMGIGDKGKAAKAEYAGEVVASGGSVVVIADDPEEAEGTGKAYLLDVAAVRRGLDLTVKEGRITPEFLDGSADAGEADCFLQRCLFGEVVYA
ncbi:MAG: hypothetical protein WC986_14605 [Elusimicrobiota bacterium]|jgi:hypothetical protein